MVKRINQSEAGGAVNPHDAFDPVQGSVPLEKPQATPTPSSARPNIIGDLSSGAHFIGDVPEDATPDQAVQYAQGDPVKEKSLGDTGAQMQRRYEEHYRRQPGFVEHTQSQVQTAAQSYAKSILGDPLPRVDVTAGRVMFSEFHIRPDGTLHLDPEDAEDLIDLLQVNVKRAKRQQL